MSDFVQRLRRQAKELNALERDLRVKAEESVDWKRTTMSSAVVGLGIPVERSFLADYFLTTWAEWRGLFERYPRYFGLPSEELPHQWHQTDHLCRRLADTLLGDHMLGEVLAASWQGQESDAEQPAMAESPRDAEVAALYRGIVRNHLRLSAVAATDTEHRVGNGSWSRCVSVLRRNDAAFKTRFSKAPANTREAVLWHLRHFRHAALALSWLNHSPHSTLDRLLTECDTTTEAAQHWLPAFNGHIEKAHEVKRVVTRVTQTIAEIGYDCFVEDVTSKEFVGGEDSPIGSADVLLLPGERHNGKPATIVAVTRGKSGRARLGFIRVMEQIKTVLSEEKDGVRFLLVLCDNRDSAIVRSQYLSDLRRFPRLQSLFLVVGSQDTVLAPLAIEPTVEE